MARRTSPPTPPADDFREQIVDVDVADEMQGSFLEYAYSVIYARALPDARDGLKPVHRRILYQMADMGLRPDRSHVKSARVVGEVMGKLHPHGDGAIYDALVRMAQPFSMRVPLVDGHGNFGSLDDGPAAMRYTECRLDPAALLMTASIDEDVVDFGANYDGALTEPAVLPAAFPNLLVNGTTGIAVGMATNMPPHNLGEVVAAARHLLRHPDATLDDIMAIVPGPDLPTGGKIVGLDGVREAYETGRGTFRIRAATRVEALTARRRGIVVTELPFGVGPERVIEKIGELVKSKRMQGISFVSDLSDGEHGMRVVIEIKSGFVPEAVLEQLFRLTPMEETFGINNVALVDGQPLTLGLLELLQVYVDHRIEVVRRRSQHRRRKAADRLHLVSGLLVAIIDIDEVIELIRSSEDAAEAKARLMQVFELSDVQATYILDMPLRRLTRLSRIELESERDELGRTIEQLDTLLADERALRQTVSDELAEVAKTFSTPRRTVLLESAGQPVTASAGALEVPDEPCRVLLSSTGLLARTTDAEPLPTEGPRARHDVVLSWVLTTARGDVGAVTSAGRVLRLGVLDLPALPRTANRPNLAGGAQLSEFLQLGRDERVLALTALDGPGLALGTEQGVVKRVQPDYPSNRAEFEVVRLESGDRVVGAVELAPDSTAELVFVTSAAQVLRFPATSVRPQGRAAAGMAGIRLGAGEHVVYFGSVDPSADNVLVTVAGSSDALPGTMPGSAKVTALDLYPGKGRATGGVRCQRFLRGEDRLVLAWAGLAPGRAASAAGVPVQLPEPDERRDGSGTELPQAVAAIG